MASNDNRNGYRDRAPGRPAGPTGPTADELPRTAPALDAPKVDPATLPPEAFSSAAPATSADVLPAPIVPPDPEKPPVVIPGPSSAPPIEPQPVSAEERQRYADELADQLVKCEQKHHEADPGRLHELHYLAAGQVPPAKLPG